MAIQQAVHRSPGEPLGGVFGVAVPAHAHGREPETAPGQLIRLTAPAEVGAVGGQATGVGQVIGHIGFNRGSGLEQCRESTAQPAVDVVGRAIPEPGVLFAGI